MAHHCALTTYTSLSLSPHHRTERAERDALILSFACSLYTRSILSSLRAILYIRCTTTFNRLYIYNNIGTRRGGGHTLLYYIYSLIVYNTLSSRARPRAVYPRGNVFLTSRRSLSPRQEINRG